MFDFTEAVAPICESVQAFRMKVLSSNGRDSYTVEFGPTPYGPYQHNWSCSCPAGQAGKRCRHIEDAKTQRCGWNSELEPQRIPDGHVCPWCRGPLKYVKVAV